MAIIADIANAEGGSSVRGKLNDLIGRHNLGVAADEKIIEATTYTLLASDAGKVLIFTAATAVTVTIETNAVQAFPARGSFLAIQAGAGAVSIAPVSGSVTINGNLNTNGQNTGVSGYQRAVVDTWQMLGGVA